MCCYSYWYQHKYINHCIDQKINFPNIDFVFSVLIFQRNLQNLNEIKSSVFKGKYSRIFLLIQLTKFIGNFFKKQPKQHNILYISLKMFKIIFIIYIYIYIYIYILYIGMFHHSILPRRAWWIFYENFIACDYGHKLYICFVHIYIYIYIYIRSRSESENFCVFLNIAVYIHVYMCTRVCLACSGICLRIYGTCVWVYICAKYFCICIYMCMFVKVSVYLFLWVCVCV